MSPVGLSSFEPMDRVESTLVFVRLQVYVMGGFFLLVPQGLGQL